MDLTSSTMLTQHAGDAILKGDNSTLNKTPTVDMFDKPPPLPGLDTLKLEKGFKTTLNKFKIKISFTVPRNDKIKPRDKFVMLISVFQQKHNDTTLEQWDTDEMNQAQSIVSGSDLPHEQEKLSVYCPHMRWNTCLETQWRLKSTAWDYDFKTNSAILAHL
eukprot:4624267-Ditylum_brightwellii.AAC.1